VTEFSNLRLSDEERAMHDGEAGPAARLAMRILARVAPLYGADHLIEITRAHIDGCILEGSAGLAFAERMADRGAVRVPTSLNVISLDRRDWRAHGLPADYADRARRLADAYLRMGATPSFTCAPYQTLPPPAFGEQIAWSESNAVAFANSALGARTNRYGDYLDICCALTGRAPAAGLHLTENRRATLVVRLVDIPPALFDRDDFYPVLGYLLGTLAGDQIPAVVGLDAAPSEDRLKALLAAAATSGAVALAHLVGITPEAPTLAAALGGRAPERTLDVALADLRAARAELSTAADAALGAVAFGSPHCSLAECRELARLMAGCRKADRVKVFVTTSRAVRDLLERDGALGTLRAFGATVTADTCIVVAPLLGDVAGALMTNSAKYAHYGPGILGVGAVFGSTADCVASAVAGRVVNEDGPWAT
jgi:hypothetical protein